MYGHVIWYGGPFSRRSDLCSSDLISLETEQYNQYHACKMLNAKHSSTLLRQDKQKLITSIMYVRLERNELQVKFLVYV